MKFWKITLFCFLSIFSLFFWMSLHILEISKEDKEDYRKLMEVSHSNTALKLESKYTAKQLKEGVKKTLLLNKEDGLRIGKLSSLSSTLFLSKDNQKSELREEMLSMDLLYQEELLADEQIVVQVNADHATYYYNQEKLEADNVRISRYKMPSHEFPTALPTPFFTGRAQAVSIAFGNSQPKMHAKNLKATSQ